MKKLLLILTVFAAFTVNAQNIAIKATIKNPRCAGDATGWMFVNVDGGAAPYHYLWSTGDTAYGIQHLVAGEYSVTVTDDNGLSSSSSIKLVEPPALDIQAMTINASGPGANDGMVNVTVRGGTVEYSFLWSNGDNTKDIGQLYAGTYTLTVTDGFGCQKSITKTITDFGPMHQGNYGNHLSDESGMKLPANGNLNSNLGVFPNPTSGQMNLRLKGNEDGQYTILNMNGEIVDIQKFSNGMANIDGSNLPNGSYLIKTNTATQSISSKINIIK